MKPDQFADMPSVVRSYFALLNKRDGMAAVNCFTAQASAEDGFGYYSGGERIHQWLHLVCEIYSPTLEVLRRRPTHADVAYAVRVAGNFPGSPVELDFHFSMRGERIEQLVIE